MMYFSIKSLKLDIKKLKEILSLKLFITHSHGNQVKLPKELDDLSRKIVKACID